MAGFPVAISSQLDFAPRTRTARSMRSDRTSVRRQSTGAGKYLLKNAEPLREIFKVTYRAQTDPDELRPVSGFRGHVLARQNCHASRSCEFGKLSGAPGARQRKPYMQGMLVADDCMLGQQRPSLSLPFQRRLTLPSNQHAGRA